MQTHQFIANINELYKPALNSAQQKFYNQFLNGYTDNQLDELWDITMQTHPNQSPPPIGKLKEYAKQVTPLKVVSAIEQKKEELKQLTDEEIFTTRLGRLALRQGWADSYQIHCRRHSIPEQGDDVLLSFQKAQQAAEDGYRHLQTMKNPTGMLDMTAGLIKLRESMRQKNRDLCEKYKQLWQQPKELRHTQG